MSKRGDDPRRQGITLFLEVPTYTVVPYPEQLVIKREHDMLCVVDTGHVGDVCDVMWDLMFSVACVGFSRLCRNVVP